MYVWDAEWTAVGFDYDIRRLDQPDPNNYFNFENKKVHLHFQIISSNSNLNQNPLNQNYSWFTFGDFFYKSNSCLFRMATWFNPKSGRSVKISLSKFLLHIKGFLEWYFLSEWHLCFRNGGGVGVNRSREGVIELLPKGGERLRGWLSSLEC